MSILSANQVRDNLYHTIDEISESQVADRRKKKHINGSYFTQATLYVLLLVFLGCEPSMKTVKSTTDQNKLANIALHAKNSLTSKAAVEKVTDQSLLAKIAIEANSYSVRKAAVEKITDQNLLIKISVGAKDSSVRKAAVEKLIDQKLLAKIAVEDKDSSVRKAAVEKLTDQSLLAKIAVEANSYSARKAAEKKVTDQSLLANAVENMDKRARKEALLAEKEALLAELDKIITRPYSVLENYYDFDGKIYPYDSLIFGIIRIGHSFDGAYGFFGLGKDRDQSHDQARTANPMASFFIREGSHGGKVPLKLKEERYSSIYYSGRCDNFEEYSFCVYYGPNKSSRVYIQIGYNDDKLIEFPVDPGKIVNLGLIEGCFLHERTKHHLGYAIETRYNRSISFASGDEFTSEQVFEKFKNTVAYINWRNR